MDGTRALTLRDGTRRFARWLIGRLLELAGGVVSMAAWFGLTILFCDLGLHLALAVPAALAATVAFAAVLGALLWAVGAALFALVETGWTRARRLMRRRQARKELRPLLEAAPERDEVVALWRSAGSSGWVAVSEDESGILYRGAGVALMLVENATAERDGSRKRYVLRVPPWVETPREAVAWTFGLAVDSYAPVAES